MPANTRVSGARAETVLALLGYCVVALGFTALVWVDPTRTWVGDYGDPYKFLDFFGWIPHALGSGHNPLFMDAIDYPHGVNLTWDTPMPLATVVVWPITALFGVIAGYNAWLLIALTLNGWCTYLWLRRHTQSAGPALLGGLVIAVGPYVSAHALGHPNLLSFFPIPLMFIATERIVESRGRAWKPAIALGLMAACQVYLSEELLALTAIGVAVTLLVAILFNLAGALEHAKHALPWLAAAAGIFLVLAAPMLAFQFFGPNRIHGLIQPYNYYVTNLENLVIPTDRTLVRIPALSASQSALWNGNTAEKTAYLGIPLILLAAYVAVRNWRVAWVRVIAVATALVLVLSFGPSLHIAAVNTVIRLPSAVLNRLPLLDNMEPSRFSLIAAFGFAFLLAKGLDQTVFGGGRRNVATSVLAVLSVLFLLPPGPAVASSTAVPRYFTAQGAARQLPAGSVALIAPYTVAGLTVEAMLWQAESDFSFSLIDGLAITAGPGGKPVFLLSNDVSRAFTSIQQHGVAPPQTPEERGLLEAELARDHVTVIIIGPMAHREQAVSLITWLTGSSPRQVQGVSVWNL